MSRHVIEYSLPEGSRFTKRKALIGCFLNELPGEGAKELSSRYTYIVETYGEYSIFLKRPTWLNKGFDFTVNIEGVPFFKNRKYSCPSHEDIFAILSQVQAQSEDEYRQVSNAINDIYECVEPDLTTLHSTFVDYMGNEHPIQIVLLAIKWLFMEQDCAYWNYSGRNMLYTGLQERSLV